VEAKITTNATPVIALSMNIRHFKKLIVFELVAHTSLYSAIDYTRNKK
jgi:hypothetical protein